MSRILVTGSSGQIGSELVPALRKMYGRENIIASDIKEPSSGLVESGPFEPVDVTDRKIIEKVVEQYDVDTVYHLAALLSASGEQKPQLAYNVNMNGLYNILEVAREKNLVRIFFPSSIAAFGPETEKNMTPQDTVMRPRTMYGVTKVAGELLCDYYFYKYGLDVRGVRYPGVISSEVLPTGGTTDYAVEIFYDAIRHGRYVCFVSEDTVLPMIYMPDCLKAAIDIMEADISKLEHHNGFNISALSFSAGELANEIKKYIPKFKIEYKPDFRQKIADSWPRSLDDSAARKEWGWKPYYDLTAMTKDMLENLRKRIR